MRTANVEKIRDQVRAYLGAHPDPQPDLAERIGISHSWLNKFIRGQFDDLGVVRLNELVLWIEGDKRSRIESGLPPVRPKPQVRTSNHARLAGAA